MKRWDIIKELPNVNFFEVGINGKAEIFITLDNSVGFYSIQSFCPANDMMLIDYIDHLYRGKFSDECDIYRTFLKQGVCFAETGKRYKITDYEDLKKDYFIADIAGLSTRIV
jgi:hypothetical protein